MLNSSIALHLILDIGTQLWLISGRPTIRKLTFRTTVKKFFQGKVIIVFVNIKLKD